MTKPKSNVFDLSHDVKLSFNQGELIPTCCVECVPGDKFSLGCESLVRFQPMVAPVMHRFNVTMHYFFVPFRILWDRWEKFITNTDDGGGVPAFPTVLMNTANYSRLADYLGIPPPIGANTETISAMPFAAYQRIWQEYYRDQNVMDVEPLELVDGDNSAEALFRQLRLRNWEHDYFTSALPYAQKGDAVNLPIGIFEDVNVFREDPLTGNNSVAMEGIGLPGAGNDDPIVLYGTPANAVGSDLYADTSSLQPDNVTINDLRRSFRLQEWLEKNARGGTRYIENILMHFGVRSSDKRLNRPEYITGTKSPVVVSEVLNTSDTAEAPQGNMSGHAVSVTAGKYGRYFAEEHGYIVGIMSVLPKTAYQQGIPRMFSKTEDPFQYYWPSFAHIGEQEIKNKEIYAYQAAGAGENTFGYIPRYSEYKFENSRIAGDFRTTLDFWHAGRIFAAPPALNASFQAANPTHRIFAVTDTEEHKMLAHVYHKIKAVRRMPKFGTPTF